MVVLILAFIED